MKNHISKIFLLFFLLNTYAFSVQIQCVAGCSSCDNPYTCNQCQSGKQCCYQTCSNCVNQITCTKCTFPYTLNKTNGVCYLSACPLACAQCNNGICSSCDAGSMLISLTNECVACSDYCESCQSPSKCTTCIDRYFLTSNLTCSQCPENCFFCKSATSCSTCVNGFYPQNGVCEQCTANCEQCNSLTTCSQCSASFYLNDNKQCLPCQSKCRQCTGKSSCSQCVSGYGLLKGVCVSCNNQFTACTQCQQEQNKLICQQCNAGFFLVNQTQCQQCIENCLECNSGNSCYTCNPGYYYNSVSNACLKCTQPNCFECNGGSICTSCNIGYFLAKGAYNGTCQLCPTGCDNCINLAWCTGCSDGYYSEGNFCYPCQYQCKSCSDSPYKCTQCNDGYYLDVYTLRCLPCPDFCPSCSDPTNCTKCSNGFYLQNAECLQCTTQNCMNCQNNKCTLCELGYYLDGSSCDMCPENCDICTDQKTCNSCYLGFFLDSGICQPCGNNCEFCLNQKNCSHCLSGFYLDANNSCKACNDNCTACLKENVCTSCPPKKYLVYSFGISTGVCGDCEQPCRTCTGSQSSCLSCVSGYYLSQSGVCSKCQEGCYDCNHVIGCLACLPGYFKVNITTSGAVNFQTYKCVSCTPNCLTCQFQEETKKKMCTRCASGFAIGQNGHCFPCGTGNTHGCKQCDIQPMVEESNGTISYITTCSECLPGFMVNDTTHICVPDVGGSSSGVFFIICIVAMGVGCAILLGMIIYNCFRGNSQESGMYKEIS